MRGILMHFSMQELLLGDTSLVLIVFAILGGILYVVDYLPAKTAGDIPRELGFKRILAYLYMIGGATLFAALKLLNLFL